MLPAKLRAAKVTAKLFDPQGIDRWIAPRVARGVAKTTLQWMADRDRVQLDDLDCAILRWTCRHLGLGQGLAFNPFHGGGALCGDTMTISTTRIRRLFDAS